MRIKTLKIFGFIFCLCFSAMMISGCGSDDSGSSPDNSGGNPSQPDEQSVAFLTIRSEKAAVTTDGSDSVKIEVSALDQSRGPVADKEIRFTASGGRLSASKAKTSDEGVASISLHSSEEKASQVVTVTVEETGGKTASIPIRFIGTSIDVALSSSSIQAGEQVTVTANVTDGGKKAVYGADVLFEATGDGAVQIPDGEYKTDENGNAKVVVTASRNGDFVIRASSLGEVASKNISVGTSGNTFKITSPAEPLVSRQYNSATKEVMEITVQSPGAASGDLQFVTSIGGWGAENGPASLSVPKATAKATLFSGDAGVATITVFDKSDTSKIDSVKIAISAPASEASKVTLQATPTVIAPSGGGVVSVSTLEAKVYNDEGQVVSGAPVLFRVLNPVGGGEFLDPSVVFTDDLGVAKSTLTAGSIVTDSNGLKCEALITKADASTETATVPVQISGDASSVAIGRATKIQAMSDTEYLYPMTVMVSDSNGNPVKNIDVNLGVWPTEFATGVTYPEEVTDEDGNKLGPGPVQSNWYDNEDENQNNKLDGNEDGLPGDTTPGKQNGILDPPRSAAGSVPVTVTTDENGVAQFKYIYPKQYAGWLRVEISASTRVFGSESTSKLTFALPWLEDEGKYIPSSPWGR